LLNKPRHNKGQATTELAVMGAIVLMLLGYLMQQGFIYNTRQSLEMYTFRKALELSRDEERGIDLTVIRDVISPSFFSGLNRQRVMATTIIDYNPWMLWVANKDEPKDIGSRKFIQVNEGMIKNNYFFEVPPTLAKIEPEEGGSEEEEDKWKWISSAVSEIDPQTKPVKVTTKTSKYANTTTTSEDQTGSGLDKQLQSEDKIPTIISFERDLAKIKDEYEKDDWDNKIKSVDMDMSTIPKDVGMIVNETVRREKSARTPQ